MSIETKRSRGDRALMENLLAASGGRCVSCGTAIDWQTVKLVEVPPPRYEPPSPIRILSRTEPRCVGCARYAPR